MKKMLVLVLTASYELLTRAQLTEVSVLLEYGSEHDEQTTHVRPYTPVLPI
jgi:hypothetical protein